MRVGIGLGAIGVAAALVVAPSSSAGDSGRLVAKDVGSGKSPVAVATATIQNPGKLSFTITSQPAGEKVAWIYTTDCFKGGRAYQYPPPGKAGDTVSRSKVKRTMDLVVDNPDFCQVAVSGKLDYKSGKKITAKIFEE